MSELAKTARSAMRDKIKRMVTPHTGKVDASDYDAPATFSADTPTGKAPVTRQHKFKRGGKVEGEASKVRADKAPRHGPKRVGKQIGGSLAMLSPALMAANAIRGDDEDRPGKASGGNVGDTVPTQRFGFNSGASRMSKSLGLNKGGSVSDGALQGTRPTGGRIARKSGGRAKGKTDINIIISAGGKDQPQPAPMMPPPKPPLPAMPPMGAMPGGPPPMMPGAGPMGAPPPGLMPSGGPPMPLPRKRGGRAYPIDAGAGSGIGRLEKARQA